MTLMWMRFWSGGKYFVLHTKNRHKRVLLEISAVTHPVCFLRDLKWNTTEWQILVPTAACLVAGYGKSGIFWPKVSSCSNRPVFLSYPCSMGLDKHIPLLVSSEKLSTPRASSGPSSLLNLFGIHNLLFNFREWPWSFLIFFWSLSGSFPFVFIVQLT